MLSEPLRIKYCLYDIGRKLQQSLHKQKANTYSMLHKSSSPEENIKCLKLSMSFSAFQGCFEHFTKKILRRALKKTNKKPPNKKHHHQSQQKNPPHHQVNSQAKNSSLLLFHEEPEILGTKLHVGLVNLHPLKSGPNFRVDCEKKLHSMDYECRQSQFWAFLNWELKWNLRDERYL